MPIYLRHAVHGTKVAVSDFEADYDMQRGWEEFDPTEDVVEDESDEPVNELQPRRRGRRGAPERFA